MSRHHSYERIAVFVFGVIFVATILLLATLYPEPTNFQYTVFRIVLALAAAGVAAFVPGFLELAISKWLRAGGAMAVFAIVYFYSPAQLVYQPKIPKPGQEVSFITESMTTPPQEEVTKNEEFIYKIYFTVWNLHPYEKVRVSGFDIDTIEEYDQIAYCCPETRSLFRISLDIGATSNVTAPLETTFEIPPSSSHTFEADIELIRGIPDRQTAVWFGLVVNYSSPDGALHKKNSNTVFVVNTDNLDGVYDLGKLNALRNTPGNKAELATLSIDWLKGVNHQTVKNLGFDFPWQTTPFVTAAEMRIDLADNLGKLSDGEFAKKADALSVAAMDDPKFLRLNYCKDLARAACIAKIRTTEFDEFIDRFYFSYKEPRWSTSRVLRIQFADSLENLSDSEFNTKADSLSEAAIGDARFLRFVLCKGLTKSACVAKIRNPEFDELDFVDRFVNAFEMSQRAHGQ